MTRCVPLSVYPFTFPWRANWSNVRGSMRRYAAASFEVSQFEMFSVIRSTQPEGEE